MATPVEIIKTENSASRHWKGFFKDFYDDLIEEIQTFQQETFTIYGKTYTPNRFRTSQGDKNTAYRYTNHSLKAEEWTPTVLKLKRVVEKVTNSTYNFVLINYYPNGSSSLGWHSDDQRDIVKGATIASVSFGQERAFQMRKRAPKGTKTPIVSVQLGSGDLLTMEGSFQSEFKHCVPARKRLKKGRISLTFRHVK